MDQRSNPPQGGVPQATGSLRPPVGYPPEVRGQAFSAGSPQGSAVPPGAPQQGGFAPQQTGYMPPQAGTVPPGAPQQGGFAPQQTGYMPPQNGAVPPGTPPQGGFAPQQTGYMPPQAGAVPPGTPPQDGFAPQQTGYMPPQNGAVPSGTPQQGGFAPPTGFRVPTTPVRRPRRTPRWVKALSTLAVLVVAGVAAWYLYEALVPNGVSYATIEAGMIGASYTGDCLIVRNEIPYDAEGVTSVEHLAPEASTVSYNQDICEVFSSGYSTREMNALQEYRDAIRDYQKELLDTETTYDARMTHVQSEVVNRAKEIRATIAGARGSLSNQESLMAAAVEVRQQYLRSVYADDQRLTRLYDDEASQLQRIKSWTKKYISSQEGVVSFYSDGYEYGLTSQNYRTFTPSQVRAMAGGQRPDTGDDRKGKTTIYRIVHDGSWNVLFLARQTDWNPVAGQAYELKLERFEEMTVSAVVEDFVRSGGELLLQLSVTGPVADVLYMRTCQAELGESISTLRVPVRAIYTQDGIEGVVTVSGGMEGFIPVNVHRRSDGYAYITAIQQGLLFEGQTIRLF